MLAEPRDFLTAPQQSNADECPTLVDELDRNDRDPPFLAALLTPRGRGAVATIRVQSIQTGDFHPFLDSFPFQSANGKGLNQQKLNRIVFGRWGVDPGEEVVLCRSTSESLEIHCHGGLAAADRILGDLQTLGGRIIGWEEFVRRSAGEFQQSWESALSQSTTLRTAALIFDQQAIWKRQVAIWRDDLQRGQLASLKHTANEALRWKSFGIHLTHPYRVVLAGRPNVGKSSLINALVGFRRSIVFDQPGTTRDIVTAETTWDGWPILLSDTAGLRKNATELEARGIELTGTEVQKADLVLFVHDARELEVDPGLQAEIAAAGLEYWDEERNAEIVHTEELETVGRFSRPTVRRLISVVNKIDLVPPEQLQTLNERSNVRRISALTGQGLDDLIELSCQSLIPRLPEADALIPFTQELVEWLKRLECLVEQGTRSELETHLNRLFPPQAGK